MDARSERIVLEARGIVKSFPGVVALDDVSLPVYRGQLNAVVGENGAGKSTLMNVLAGVYPPDAGEIVLDGELVVFADTREAHERGIAIIHQELNLIPHLSVAENIFLGREFTGRLGLVDTGRMNRQAERILAQLDLSLDPRAPVAGLRVGHQQIVEIAKALSTRARVIIMDEPTSALSEHETDVLFGLIRTLKEQDVAVVYITHKLDELFGIGDRLTVLRDGRLAGAGLLADLAHDDVVRMMVGRDVGEFYKRTSHAGRREVLRVEGITLRHPQRTDDRLVDNVSFSVRRGEVLGIFGLMGAGRSELLETIFGLHPGDSSGGVFVDGARVSAQSPDRAIACGIGFAPEDRKEQGLVLTMSVGANISLATLGKVESYAMLHPGRERQLVDTYVDRLRIRTPSLGQTVRNLSGGNQQKVVLAKWLATAPKVLLLDEPTRGIDINAKREIYGLIEELTGEGLGIVMVSSELPEVLAVSDRIMVMSEGRKTANVARAEATEERIMKAALPQSVRQNTATA